MMTPINAFCNAYTPLFVTCINFRSADIPQNGPIFVDVEKSLQADAFRGHGFSRFPRYAQSRIFSSRRSVALLRHCSRRSRRLPFFL